MLVELISCLLDKIFQKNEVKIHSKKIIAEKKIDLLNEIEKQVSDLILNTWIFFDGDKEATDENILNEIENIKEKLLHLKSIKNQSRTYLSNELYNIITEVELEITEQIPSVQTLFFVKSSKLDRLEKAFLELLMKEKSKIK